MQKHTCRLFPERAQSSICTPFSCYGLVYFLIISHQISHHVALHHDTGAVYAVAVLMPFFADFLALLSAGLDTLSGAILPTWFFLILFYYRCGLYHGSRLSPIGSLTHSLIL